MGGENRQRQDDGDDRVSRLVTRLQDLLVEEISAVDRAANKRRFLVVKTEGDDMPTGEEVFEQGDGTMTTDAFGTVEAAAGATDDKATDDDKPTDAIDGTDKATPANVKAAVVRMLEESGSKLDALVGKLKAAKGFVPPPLMGEAKAIVTILRGVASRYPSPKAKSDEPDADATTDDSDAATGDATDVAKANAAAAATALAAASGKIKALVGKVKALEEGDGSLPGDIGKAIDAIAMAIESALGLAAAAKKADPPGDGDKDQPSGLDAGQAVIEAAKLLQVALGKLAAGKPCDDESLRMIGKAREVLATAAKSKAKAKKSDDEPGDEPSDEREPTAKAGTKQLSRARREKFKGALDSLIKLFEEMIPEAERKGMWPTRKAAEPEPEPVAKSDDDEKVVELRKAIEERDAKIAKLAGVIKDRDDEPGDSNLVPIGKGGGDDNGTERAVWEHDLNEPDADAPW
jgi:hypothetical protein